MRYINLQIAMKREFSAGGLVFKKHNGDTLWLVRRPTAGKGYRGNLGWGFPKGWIDKGETTEQAALREVKEEGGVVAKIISKLSTLKVFFTNQEGEKIMKFITYFVMEYESDTPEGHDWETEETKWVTFAEAKDLLVHKNEKELLQKAVVMLE